MKDLIARLEKAKGPDRELDFAIASAVHGPLVRQSSLHLPYTSSVDAAMTLVPEGWDYCLAKGCDELASASLAPAKQVTEIFSMAPTQPLAICIGALRARAD